MRVTRGTDEGKWTKKFGVLEVSSPYLQILWSVLASFTFRLVPGNCCMYQCRMKLARREKIHM